MNLFTLRRLVCNLNTHSTPHNKNGTRSRFQGLMIFDIDYIFVRESTFAIDWFVLDRRDGYYDQLGAYAKFIMNSEFLHHVTIAIVFVLFLICSIRTF